MGGIEPSESAAGHPNPCQASICMIYNEYHGFCNWVKGANDITLCPESLKTWSYSLHACSEIINDLNKMQNKEMSEAPQRRNASQNRNISQG